MHTDTHSNTIEVASQNALWHQGWEQLLSIIAITGRPVHNSCNRMEGAVTACYQWLTTVTVSDLADFQTAHSHMYNCQLPDRHVKTGTHHNSITVRGTLYPVIPSLYNSVTVTAQHEHHRLADEETIPERAAKKKHKAKKASSKYVPDAGKQLLKP
jgi:hypothetical protein